MIDVQPIFQDSTLAGRKQFEVPWEKADDIRLRLAKKGISATAILKTEEKKAEIEVDNEVQADAILAALA